MKNKYGIMERGETYNQDFPETWDVVQSTGQYCCGIGAFLSIVVELSKNEGRPIQTVHEVDDWWNI